MASDSCATFQNTPNSPFAPRTHTTQRPPPLPPPQRAHKSSSTPSSRACAAPRDGGRSGAEAPQANRLLPHVQEEALHLQGSGLRQSDAWLCGFSAPP